jgi:hypothetical protein
MKQIIFITFALLISSTVFAQRNLKFNFKHQKEYSATSDNWSKVENINLKYIFKFKKKEIIKVTDSGEETLQMTSWSEATDDQTLEDCFLIFAKDGGEALRLILYKNEARGVRIIKKNGNIQHYFTQ